jgi:hypothetical protein
MELPTLKNGEVVNDLGKYMTELLGNFKTFRISQSWYIYWTRWNYSFWWHGGIGSISNVFGECKIALILDKDILICLKNKIISDLSNGVLFNLN